MRKDPLYLETFVLNWKNTLRLPSPLWEGPVAVRELQEKRLLQFLRCDKRDWRQNELLKRVVREARIYREEVSALRKGFSLTVREAKDVELFLADIERKTARRARKTHSLLLKALLKRVRTELEDHKREVPHLSRRSSLVSPLGIWEHLWPRIRRPGMARRAIDLDRTLQIQLGKIFSTFLRKEEPKLSLITVARLVVLAYYVGELAKEYRGQLLILNSGRPLSVRTVYDKLRYARLDAV